MTLLESRLSSFPEHPDDGFEIKEDLPDGGYVIWKYSEQFNEWTYEYFTKQFDGFVYTDQVRTRSDEAPAAKGAEDASELFTQRDVNHYLNNNAGDVDLSHLEGAVDELQKTDNRHDDEIGTLKAKVEALEGTVIDGVWKLATSSTPRTGEFDLLDEQGSQVRMTWIAKTIRYNKTDNKGETFAFASAKVGDYIRVGGQGASCVYQVTEVDAPSQMLEWQSFGIEHITSIHYPTVGQAFDFEFLPVFDATAYATKAYVDSQDDVVRRYIDGLIPETGVPDEAPDNGLLYVRNGQTKNWVRGLPYDISSLPPLPTAGGEQ